MLDFSKCFLPWHASPFISYVWFALQLTSTNIINSNMIIFCGRYLCKKNELIVYLLHLLWTDQLLLFPYSIIVFSSGALIGSLWITNNRAQIICPHSTFTIIKYFWNRFKSNWWHAYDNQIKILQEDPKL